MAQKAHPDYRAVSHMTSDDTDHRSLDGSMSEIGSLHYTTGSQTFDREAGILYGEFGAPTPSYANAQNQHEFDNFSSVCGEDFFAVETVSSCSEEE